jgi:hypothetical protein
MKTITKWLAAFSCAAIFIFFLACNKNSMNSGNGNIPPGHSKASIYLMDGPAMYFKVLIDIRQVAVKVDTGKRQSDPDDPWEWDEDRDNTIWDTLSITPGIYNLLDLRNGVDTLLASGFFPNGKILKIRITLGSDNSIFTDSLTSYPLEVFGPHPYFDINVRREDVFSVTNNNFEMWLDFNLHRSIFFWNGEFLLKPVIVVFNDHTSPKVEGEVLPPGASPLVELYNQTDTIYAVPDWDGDYLVRGVNAGTYSLAVTGHHGYNDTTISNIVVSGSGTTRVPTVTLHK